VSDSVVAAEGVPQREATIDQAGERRSSQIESLRAVAALSVVVCHVTLVYIVLATKSQAFLDPTVVERLLYAGGFGVSLFFALTGYLIFRPFVKRFAGATGPISLSTYGINRALRILPLYFVVMAVVLAIENRPLDMWIRFFTFTQNYWSDTAGQINGPAWSLAVEIQFYFLLPLLALAIGRLSKHPLRAAVATIAVLGIASLIARFALIENPDFANATWRYRIVTNFIFFVPGMLIALIEVGRRGRRLPIPRGLARSDLWFAGGVALWMAVVMKGYDWDFLIAPASFLVLGACVLGLRAGAVHSVLSLRPLASLGIASYSLYLWHFPLLELLTNEGASPELIPLAAIAIPTAILVAMISYRLIEEPFLRLRGRWAS
jgi:peptidoglycan/LPS O-acetylase OafA/YrhL